MSFPGAILLEDEESDSLGFGGIPLEDDEEPNADVVRTAQQQNISPATVQHLGHWTGRLENALAKTAAGQVLLRAEQGMSEAVGTGVSMLSRAGLAPAHWSQNAHRDRQLRQEFLNMAEQGGDIQTVLGERGSRILNSTVNTVSKMGLAAQAGPAAVYSLIGAESFDTALEEVKDKSPTEQLAYAGSKAAIELGVTFLMGKVAGKYGVESAEEALSPGMRQAAGKIAGSVFKRGAAGAAFEAGEESLVSTLQQIVELDAGTRKAFDWGQVFESGLTGAGARGVIGGINTTLGKSSQKIDATVKGVLAAEEAMSLVQTAQGPPKEAQPEPEPETPEPEKPETDEVEKRAGTFFREPLSEKTLDTLAEKEGINREEFEKLTGLRNTSQPFRESFVDTVKLQAETKAEPPADGAPAAEGEAEPPQITSVRQDIIERNRAMLDLAEVPEQERLTFANALETAKKNNVPARALDISTGLLAKPRALTPVESAGLTVRMADISNQFKAAAEKLIAADNPGDEATHAAEMNRLQDEYDTISVAAHASGSERGRALAFQKLAINQNFDLVNVMARARVAKGDKLTVTEADKLKGLATELEQLEKRLANFKGSDDALNDLLFRAHKARAQVSQSIRDTRPQTFWDKVRKPLDFQRALKSSIDFPLLRQGKLALLSHPVVTALNTTYMRQAFVSEQNAFNIRQKHIEGHPNAKWHEKIGLFRHREDSDLSHREEGFYSVLAQKLPFIAASQRAYTTFMDKLRVDMYETLANNYFDGSPTQDQAKGLAGYVNVMTGRGGLGQFEHASDLLSATLYAPRYMTSRFQMLAGTPMWNTDAEVRKAIAKEYGRIGMGAGLMYAAYALLFGADDEFSVTFDPRSSDFGKIRLGNIRIDPLAGLSQATRFVARTFTGQLTTPGGRTKEMTPRQKWDDFTRFARTKLAPAPGMYFDISTGQTVAYEDATAAKLAENAVAPIILPEVAKLYRDEGVPRATILSILGLLGEGIQNYSER